MQARIREDGNFGESRAVRENHYRLQRSESAIRLETVNDRYLYLFDGSRAVFYAPPERQYYEADAAKREGKLVNSHIDHWYRRLAGRFESLASLNAQVELLKMESVKAGGRQVQCAVLQIVPDDPALGWKERLWIEPESALVWKAVMSWRPTQGYMQSVQTITWEDVRIAPQPRELFDFTPPRGARVFKKLRQPPQSEDPDSSVQSQR